MDQLMAGKTVVVTGASSGIGLETARALALLGARIVMVCRDPARAERAREDILRSLPQDGSSSPPTPTLEDQSNRDHESDPTVKRPPQNRIRDDPSDP